MKYVQCLLLKHFYTDAGYIETLKTVCWIPEKFAERKKILKLQREDGTWNDGWMVQETYGWQEESFILEHERDWARQRKASDI